ncbi:MAG TPA: amino acid adenylation domain-containing protein [Thermoanaerobaculia bacterium]|nr:amino acid adenylation domain-containing protein [Thermoanaerobaculia bacterium]
MDVLRVRSADKPDQNVYTFLAEGETESELLTYAELDRRARSLGGLLQRLGMQGENALLLFPPGLEFVVAFFGCLYGGVTAVPAYPPRPNREQPRLSAIARDARPRVVLTTSAILAKCGALDSRIPELQGARWLATDDPDCGDTAAWIDPRANGDTLAFLQYTSGSTSDPKGVMVTHGNLLHNQEMIRRAFGQDAGSVILGWLPLYHDMGLIGNVLQPLYVGARCILMSPHAFLQRPLRWLEAISRYRATTSGGPNFAYELCLRRIGPEQRPALDLSSWTVAFNGAEPVRADTLERFAAAFAPCGFRPETFYPCYGLAEATLFVAGGAPGSTPTGREVSAAALARDCAEPPSEGASAAERRSLVGCGRAWMGQRIAIVEPGSGRELPPGRVGEIWVAGPSVARGYWRRPEASERTFGARLADNGDEPYLRTGDLGFTAQGELFVTGRIKDLIILRGRNLYPQDIERTAEESHRALRPGQGAAFSAEVAGEERLVVAHEVEREWCRRAGGSEEIAEAVRRAIAEEHEARVHEVVLLRPGSLPKTSSGKVQRYAVRAAWLAGGLDPIAASPAEREGGGSAPEAAAGGILGREALLALPPAERRAPLDLYLRHAAARAARVDPAAVPLGRPLTGLGLDSLAAVELKHAVESGLGVDLPLSRLLDGASLEEIAHEVLASLGGKGAEPEERLRAGDGPGDVFPLSYGQRSLRHLERMAPGATFWTLAGAARVHGALDPAALRWALERVAERHPALRTTFHVVDGEPLQRVHSHLPPDFLEAEAAGFDEAALVERVESEAFRPFDLENGPLVRMGVFRLEPGSETPYALFLAVHHLVSDLWSIGTMMRELEAFYREARGGAPALLAPLPVTYADHVHWQRRQLAGPEGGRLWEFWRGQLGGELPVLDLSTDRPRPPVQTYRGATRRMGLDADLTEKIRWLARSRGVTLYVTLLSAFEALLHRSSGQENLLVGTPTTGRTAHELAGVVGYFVSPVVIRADLSGEPSFSELLARSRGTALAAFEHQDLPFALLAERLQVRRDPGRPPVFQVFFVLEQLPGAAGLGAFALGQGGVRTEIAGLALESLPMESRSAQFDLMLLAAETGDGLALALEHNADLFDAATADRTLGHLRELLSGAVEQPELPVVELPWLTSAERAQLLGEGLEVLAAGGAVAEGACLHHLFEERADRAPSATAVVLDLAELTYGELERRANRLAHYLMRCGVGPEVPVCLCLDRSLEMVVALLAVLKAGGAYVPLDPAYPAERLAFLLEDAGRGVARPLLVGRSRELSALSAGLPGSGLRVLDLDADRERIAAESADRPAVDVCGGNLAYIIYTSGSTGRPKGVPVSHANVVRLLTATEPWFAFDEHDVWTLFHSCAFDFSVWEIWGALAYGGRLVVVPRSVSRAPEKLYELLSTEGVTVLNQTPSVFRQVVLADATDPLPLSLRFVIFGGEALEPGTLRPWFQRHGDGSPRLVNMYGITETTVHVTYRPVTCADLAGPSAIGQPIPDLRLHLLDRRMQPVPVGVPGEIFVGGPGLARGYLHRPGLTAARFVPDPFGEPGGRLYRSGDLAIRRPDATGRLDLEYLGRIDHQVKIRGFRIELGEIEAALGSHPEVRETVVLAHQEGASARLVAYVVPRGKGAPGAAELREFLGRKLPEHMIPAVFVPLDALPLTTNGKVDRRALPSPDPEQRATPAAPAAPRTPTERALVEIWREVLGVREVGVHDDFFELGGHSLLETRLASRVRDRFRVELSLAQVFNAPTVAALAAVIEAAGGGEPAAGPLPRAPRDQPIPLSFGQERLWFLDQLEVRSAAYNVPAAVRLRGRLDMPALAAALNGIAARHEALRTSFPLCDGRPVQGIAPAVGLTPPVIDLRGLSGRAREAEARRLAREEGEAPFDLALGPLVRARLIALSPEEHLLLLTLHHAISDGWSLGVLVHELAQGYGRVELPPLDYQYADFALWQRQRVESGELDGQLAYWRQRLAGAPPRLELPADRPRPAVQSFRGRRFHRRFPARLAADLEALSQRRGLTLFMTLFAAFATLLHRLTGADDLVIGTPVANRNRSELEPLIGFFVNLLPLRADLSGDTSFSQLLARLRPEVLGAFDHQDLPFERLVAELQPERNLSETPIFQVMFVLQNNAMPALRLDGLELVPLDPDNGTSKLDLTVEATVSPEGLLVAVEHSTDLFDATRMERLAGHLGSLLEAIVRDPESRLSDLPLLSSEERQEIAEWNATDVFLPPGVCVHHLIEAQVGRTPDAPALACHGSALTYASLDRRANQLARHLRRLGVGPGDRVGLCVERSVEMVVALLGVLKAGAAYVPLDPTYPQERLALMIEDARPAVVVAQPGTLAVLPDADLRVVEITADGASLSGESPRCPAVPVPPGSLAYVMYTSGSTGRPKGVMVSHRNVVNFFTAMDARLGSGPGVWLAVTSISFDISVLELLWTLARGFHVVVHPERRWAAAGLPAQVAARGVTHLQCTPSLARMLAEEPGVLPALGSLRALLLGGEALPPDLACRLREALPDTAIHNLYGPTETTVWSATERLDAAGDVIPIGRPLANTRIYLLDRSLQPVPAGVAGEICIGGDGVTRGYLGRPELTAERFVPDAWSGEPGARLYRTGDVGRRQPGGPLEFLGRADHQIKLRGHRIELGEIEAALAAHPGVRQSVVVAREEGAGDVRLVAYFVPAEEKAAVPQELRAFLAERLIEALVPAAFVVLDALPLTPNGKIDRRALPAPAADRSETASHGALLTPAEEVLGALWADLLGVEQVGPDESFFALGGHSLLATRAVARVRAAFGVELPVRVLFETPTVRAVAAFLETARRAGSGLAVPLLSRSARPELVPLTFAQQRLRFLHQLEPDDPSYNDTAVLALEGRLDVEALQRALGEIVRRHEVLRTAYPFVDGRLVQRIAPPEPVVPPVVDLGALAPAERQREVQRSAAAEARRPFDLESGPVLRTLLLRLAAEEHVLLFSLHHIASDAWSGALLIREITAIYDAFRQGRPSPLPELPLQYADFACWQRAWLQGAVLEEHLAYWRKALGGNPPALRLPTDRPRTSQESCRGLRRTFRLSQKLSRSLGELSRREGATLFMTLLAAFDVLLQRAAGQEDVVVGTAVANRSQVETEALIGLFIEMLPLRVDLSGNPRFIDLLRRVREASLGAFAHRDFPLEQLADELRRDGDAASLFRVAFGVRNAPFEELRVPDLTIRPIELEREMVRFDVTVWVSETSEGLEITWTFRSDLFDESTIERMNRQYEALLHDAVEAPETRIDRLSLWSAEERERRVHEDQAWLDDQAGKLMSIRRRKAIRIEQHQEVAQ